MNDGQIEDIIKRLEPRLADMKREIKEELRAEFAGLRSTRKNSAGHKKAGESWERSPKGSKWKAELEAAKEELKRIIAERTGQDAYANQRLVTKYASAKRRGNMQEAAQIVEEVVENARGGEQGASVLTVNSNMTRRNKNRSGNTITNTNKNMNKNMNRLMNTAFPVLPQKPATPVAAPPAAVPKIQPVNEFNLTEPFTYGEDPMGPY